MGMLDQLLGAVLQGQGHLPGNLPEPPGGQGAAAGLPGLGAAGGAGLLGVVLQLLQQNGGLSGLVQQMQRSGYGDQAQSWIGTGQNQGLPTEALSQIFGSGALQQLAQQFGVSHDEMSSKVAQVLPEVVNRMTPQGSLPADGDDLVSRTLGELMRGQR